MSHGSVRLFVLMSLIVCPSLLPAAPVPQPSPKEVRKEQNVLWVDMMSADEFTATRALLKFAVRKDAAVSYLKEKLLPLKLSKERAKKLLTQLVDGDEATGRSAYDELMYFDPRLALGDEELKETLLNHPASRRLAAILCDLPIDDYWREKWHWYSPDKKFFRFNHGEEIQNRDAAILVAGIGTYGRKSSWVRAVRAIAVLEQIGTPDAVVILKDMATGHPDAAPTIAAKVALKRMMKK